MVALLATVALAAPQLRLEVEPTSLDEGQTGTARLLVVGDGRGVAVDVRGPPSIPSGHGLVVRFAGQTQRYSNRNGRITQVREFDYEVAAVEAGDWLVGPVELTLQDGTRIAARSVTVHVGERRPVGSGDQVAWVEGGFSSERVWEGEVVVYTYRLSTRAPSSVEWRLPPFDGLRLPQHGAPEERSYEVQGTDEVLAVFEGTVPLVATGTGRRDQPPATASVRVALRARDVFGFPPRYTAPEVYTGEPSPLEVLALPPPPPGFTGIVGDVTITSSLDAETGPVGGSLGWTITVEGDASLDGFTLPSYVADGVSVYDDDAEVAAHLEGGRYVATGRYHRVLVPTREGALDLPDGALVTFDPSEGRYVTHPLALPTVTVTPGREGTGEVKRFGRPSTDAPDVVEVIALRPPYASGRATAPALDGVLFPLLGVAALPGVAVFATELGAFASSHLRRRREKRAAAPEARGLLARLPAAPDERLAALDHVLRLLEGNAPGDPVLGELRRRLGRARFGGGPSDDVLAGDIAAAADRVERGSAA